MTIQDSWTRYSEQMANIEIFQRTIRDTANAEFARLRKFKAAEEAEKSSSAIEVATHNMLFTNANTGEKIFYCHRKLSIDDLLLESRLQKNRQYQWLLADAYELFEDFLFRAYAIVASVNKDAWPLSDYGNISLSDLALQDITWYVEQARKKKGAPRSILARIRELVPELRQMESDNALQINLSFAIVLIQEIRHLIVHAGGTTANTETFVSSVASKAGLLNNGGIAPENRQLAEQFFGVGKYGNLVTLLEVPTGDGLPIGTYHCRFGILTNVLMSYAHALHKLTETYVQASAVSGVSLPNPSKMPS